MYKPIKAFMVFFALSAAAVLVLTTMGMMQAANEVSGEEVLGRVLRRGGSYGGPAVVTANDGNGTNSTYGYSGSRSSRGGSYRYSGSRGSSSRSRSRYSGPSYGNYYGGDYNMMGANMPLSAFAATFVMAALL